MLQQLRQEIRSYKSQLLHKVREQQTKEYNLEGVVEGMEYKDLTKQQRQSIRKINRYYDNIIFELCYRFDNMVVGITKTEENLKL